MSPNPYDDPAFYEYKTAYEIAEQTILRRLVAEFFAATKRMRPDGTNQVWDFEQKRLKDLTTHDWPGVDHSEQNRVREKAAVFVSEFLSPIRNPSD